MAKHNDDIDALTGKLLRANVALGSMKTQLNTMRAANAMLNEQMEHWQAIAKSSQSESARLAQRNACLIIEIEQLTDRIKRLED